MISYVLYRLPHSASYTQMRQHGIPQTYGSLADVPLVGGYLIAPFVSTAETPFVFIRPDIVEEQPLPFSGRIDVEGEGLTDAVAEREVYGHSFLKVRALLQQKRVSKVVLSRRLHVRGIRIKDARQLFFKACTNRPDCFVALWSTPRTGTWLVATPEPLLEYAHHCWNTVALAGTLPWQAGSEPVWNAKNREEQALVRRFIHRELEAVATDIRVSDTFSLRAGNIQHLCTHFSFHLEGHEPMVRLLQNLHPTPAICGLPRPEAMQAILQNEPAPRRYYAGFSGPFMWDGQCRLYVSLRCMECDAESAILYAGGGIMPESDEQEEWEETERKMATMLELLQVNKNSKVG